MFMVPPCWQAGQLGSPRELLWPLQQPQDPQKALRDGALVGVELGVFGTLSLCLQSLCSYTEPKGTGTSPREGLPRKGGTQGNLGGSKASLETPTSLSPSLLPH